MYSLFNSINGYYFELRAILSHFVIPFYTVCIEKTRPFQVYNWRARVVGYYCFIFDKIKIGFFYF